MSDTNFDPLWLYEPEHSRPEYSRYNYGGQFDRSVIYDNLVRAMKQDEAATSYWPIITTSTNTEPGPYSWLTTSPSPSHLKDLYSTKSLFPGGIPTKDPKEQPVMGYNDSYQKSSQELIDDAVREAIEKPRREAEITKRVALVTSLDVLKDAEVGTVITFTRKNSRGDKKDVLHAALKATDTQWFVTGDGYRSNGDQQSFDSLLSWLTTGPDLAENISVATGFAPVSASA